MKKLLLIGAIISLLLGASPSLASTITDARWHGTIRITNSGDTATAVSVNMTLNTPAMISNGYANNATDMAVRIGDLDTAFMPGAGNNAMAIFVPTIAGNANIEYDFYSGNVSGGLIRYFPGNAGMTTSYDASLYPTNNFRYEAKGWLNTDNGTDKNIVSVNKAFKVKNNQSTSGNITAQIYATTADVISYAGSDDAQTEFASSNTWATQTFTPTSSFAIDGVKLYVCRAASPGNVICSIKAIDGAGKPTGSDLASVTTSANGWGTGITLTTIAFSTNYDLDAGTTYAVVLRAPSTDGTNKVYWSYDNSSPSYTGGQKGVSTDGGSTWTMTSGHDYNFKTTGMVITAVQADSIDSNEYTLDIIVSDNATDICTAGSSSASLGTSGNAFDKNVATEWYHILGTGQWIKYDLSSNAAQVCTSYNITGSSILVNSPKTWTLAGSNDNSIWTTVDTVSSSTGWGINEERYFTVDTPGYYRYYKLNLTATVDSTYYGIAEIELFPATFAIIIDSTVKDYDTNNINFPAGNTEGWVSFQNGAMPYVEYQKIWVNGVLKQYIEWEYDTTFTDLSGNGNDATPTFRTTSSDADITAALLNFAPVTEAKVDTFTLGTTSDILSGDNITISNMYGELDFTSIPGAAGVNEALTEGEIPQALWWFPFLFIGIALIGIIIYDTTTTPRSRSGSLLAMCAVIEILLGLFGIMGPLPFWPAILFLIPAIALMLSQRHYSWG